MSKIFGAIFGSPIFYIAILAVAAYLYLGKVEAENDRLIADKARLELALGAAQADMAQSVINHNETVADKDAVIKTLARAAEVNQLAFSEYEHIDKDIANAEDSHKCIDSAPVSAVLDGLRTKQRR